MTDIRFDRAKVVTEEDGLWLALRPVREDRPLARRFALGWKDKLHTACLKRFREKRSNDANAYCWALLHKLGAALRMDPVEVYRELIPAVGDNYDTVVVAIKGLEAFRRHWERRGDGASKGLGWVVRVLGPTQGMPGYATVYAYYGSSTYDTAQMSRLIDLVVQECRQQDIETLTERELSLLKEGWRAQGD